ncbi:uncharacterized protein A4U43_C05F20690 [Asparagus officinalis]|uniref:Uncharacterized protein n=3 Tax=Asparagus officinalis TaxID=4686 RepID=A0A5P1EYJ3_ASPOF|nr:uncharacterized protein A4U43_C05F20690 [Asparagus officinalis]
METEKYATILEQKHFTEIEAFTEQMRLKDEKIEAFRWRLLSRDIESKRLQSQIEVLEENLSQLREENFKFGALLMDKEEEIKSLKEELSCFVHYYQRNCLKNYPTSQVCEALTEVDTAMKKQRNMEVDSEMVNDIAAISPTDSALSADNSVDNSIICIDEITSKEALSLDPYEHAKSISLIIDSHKEETEEEKVVSIDSIHASSVNNTHKQAHAFTKESSSRIDIQALGVSYKIKRLKQQLIMLEKLAGVKQIMIGDNPCASPKDKKVEDNKQNLKGITLVIYLMSKQVKRFQSLEEKANDLCRRMHENTGGGSAKEQSRVLGNFLEETFQLQRLVVATGQKLMDIQLKIMSSINSSDGGLDESVGFNMEQFADVIGTLFRDIQRGLEVRIARIIGDLEGTLACDGIRHI